MIVFGRQCYTLDSHMPRLWGCLMFLQSSKETDLHGFLFRAFPVHIPSLAENSLGEWRSIASLCDIDKLFQRPEYCRPETAHI